MYYFAPLEGITTHTFRRTHFKYFEGIDKYFIPFVSPTINYKLKGKDKRELLLENNVPGSVPQILSKNSEDTINCIHQIMKLGYDEINLNLGCPAPTIVKRGKGSAMLENLNTLETYLDYVYLNKPKHLKLSIKTRLGYQDTDNFQNLFNLYNKYPIYELIIHSRIRDDMYHKPIRLDIYKEIQKLSYHHLIYNGDIFNHTSFQDTDNMLGRGLLRRPDLASLLKNNTLYSKQDLYKYMQELADNYYALYKDDKLTLFKMKELWAHFHLSFVENKKGFKKILKSQTVSIYKDNVEAYFNMTNLLSI